MRLGLKEESFKFTGITDDTLFKNKSISLKSTKNSFSAFQIIFECDEACTLCMTDSPAFTIYPERLIYRISASFKDIGSLTINDVSLLPDDDGILRADCIENRDYINVGSGQPINFWCEASIGSEVSSGFYNGAINIYKRNLFQTESLIKSLNIDLEVLDITLPDPANYEMHLDLWQHLSNIARKHDVRLFSETHFDIIENYTESLARLGQKAITVIATDIPWSGQRTFNDLNKPTDLFEYSLISTTKTQNGNFIFDYAVMDRYIEMCFSYGINKKIEVFGLCGIWMTEENGFGKVSADFPDGVRIRYINESDGTYSYMASESDIRLYIHSLYNHFVKKGWLEKVRITADEPGDIELYRKTIKIILEEAPGFKLSIAINKADFTTEFDSVMSDATPSLKCLATDYDFIKENLIKNEGKQVSWYVCCHPFFPNTFLQSHLLESRLIGIMTSLFGLDGFLRWNYTAWPEKPREDLVFRSGEWSTGDMNFVYPGNSGHPLLSLRFKALLRGIEDFELMTMAKHKNICPDKEIYKLLLGETTLKQLSDTGYFHPELGKPFSTDAKDYDTVRNMLYNVL
ncbi:MAG: DUF4091 domain-containing protein [Clostridiales bacterium]|nr:DUF4091 domain-containing protein [Clostridiales bacterium]